jgi:class 3 adenylate cyclase/tetratricopeptide (TPR) repeat protein
VSLTGLCSDLIHRDRQLGELEDALLEARRGQGRLVALAGEAGVGKTRLTNELGRQASRLGSVVLRGGCSEAELSLPYLPFVEAIGNYLADADAGELTARLGPTARELSQLFPQFGNGGSPSPVADPGHAKLRLFEAIVALLSVPAEDHSTLLVIEDVHWADDSSRELLDHVAKRLAGMRALVLVTYRSDELHRRHPLLPTVRAWRRGGLAEVIELAPLTEPGVAEMVASMTESEQVEPELVDLLYARTEGNPFFLEEMIRDAAACLEPGAELSRAALDDLAIPETVRDTILQRLARLEPAHVEALEAAAVLGRTFDYPTLAAVAGVEADEVQAALAAAVAALLIVEEGSRGSYGWRHALTQEAIYDEIVTPRRQAIHSRAADALARVESTPAVEIAHHLLGAMRLAEAVPVCLDGAEQAERATAFREAATLLERVLPHVGDPGERARIGCRIGHDLALNGEPGHAESFLADGIAALEELGDEVEAARHRVILGRCYWEQSQPDRARVEYERARDVLAGEGPSAELAMAYVRLAGLAVFELDFDGCLEAARSAVEIAEAAGAGVERLHALGFLALGYLDAGQSERGFEILDEAYAEARASQSWHVAQNVAWNDIWSRIHLRKGELDQRLARWDEVPSWPLHSASRASMGSYVALARGRLREAREEAELAIGLHERLGYRKMAWRCRVQLAEVLLELGSYEEAAAVLPPISERLELQDIVYDAAAQSRIRLATGRLDEALEHAREIQSRAEGLAVHRDPLLIALEAFLAGGELDAAQDVLQRAEAHPADAGSSFIDEMRGRLLLARGEAEAAGSHLEAAIRATRAEGFTMIELRLRALLAEAAGVAGDRERAGDDLAALVGDAGRIEARRIVDEARAAAERVGIELPAAPEEPPPAAPASDLQPAGERLVTSLFADVRGYTEMTAAEAPVEVANRIATLYRFATAAVERRGGVVDKFAGDAVMATFNVSGRSVDHARDALEAALTLRDKAALMDLPLGIGIATGAAILGPGASRENLAVTGVATNLAARLQAAAGPGEIILSGEAHRRVERWLRERGREPEREELALKGFDEPQGAYRITAPPQTVVATSGTPGR